MNLPPGPWKARDYMGSLASLDDASGRPVVEPSYSGGLEIHSDVLPAILAIPDLVFACRWMLAAAETEARYGAIHGHREEARNNVEMLKAILAKIESPPDR